MGRTAHSSKRCLRRTRSRLRSSSSPSFCSSNWFHSSAVSCSFSRVESAASSASSSRSKCRTIAASERQPAASWYSPDAPSFEPFDWRSSLRLALLLPVALFGAPTQIPQPICLSRSSSWSSSQVTHSDCASSASSCRFARRSFFSLRLLAPPLFGIESSCARRTSSAPHILASTKQGLVGPAPPASNRLAILYSACRSRAWAWKWESTSLTSSCWFCSSSSEDW
mmetsp:Transcript_68214/g.164953  ORF Transcript_68214/g.164953 Transcript_68214/m.164953 type:complete len:225 (-) Transcript_68214:86-760(-)